MQLMFEPTVATVPVEGSQAMMPVRRIFCVGRNYAAHAIEMGQDPKADPPFFFTKPADTVVMSGETIPYPPMTRNFHYEAELVVAIGREATAIEPEKVESVILGYAAGIDLTRRDLQLQAREKGRPWDFGKGFDKSAPISTIRPSGHFDAVPEAGSITLLVNDETRQSADLSDMIWGVRDIVSIISGYVTLRPGDLIFTGTPENVGPLEPGDNVKCAIEGIGSVEVLIEDAGR